jgi:hypothetical protein
MTTPLKMPNAKRYHTDTKVRYTTLKSESESFESFNAFLRNLDNHSINNKIKEIDAEKRKIVK